MHPLPRATFPFVLAAIAAPAYATQPISGNWLTEDGTSIVTVAPCGNQPAQLCARIVKRVAPQPPGGTRDVRNPDKKLRNRPLEGIMILWNLTDNGSAWKGRGYSHDHGVHFNAQVTREGSKLRVRGCKMLICQSSWWTKSP